MKCPECKMVMEETKFNYQCPNCGLIIDTVRGIATPQSQSYGFRGFDTTEKIQRLYRCWSVVRNKETERDSWRGLFSNKLFYTKRAICGVKSGASREQS